VTKIYEFFVCYNLYVLSYVYYISQLLILTGVDKPNFQLIFATVTVKRLQNLDEVCFSYRKFFEAESIFFRKCQTFVS
jgi:hypothetical protein